MDNTDFAPTLIELAGGQAPEMMQGRSFANTLKGKEQGTWRKGVYYRYWMHMAGNAVPAHFGVRTERYKLIFFYGCSQSTFAAKAPTPVAWELYDLEKDPNEMHNLYGKGGMEAITQELKSLLLKLREEFGDTDAYYPHIREIIDANWDD